MPINEELSDLTYQRLSAAWFIPVFPRMYMTEDALHVGLVEEVECEEVRRIGLLPARAPAPVYSYAAQQFHLTVFLGDMIVSVATFLREDQATSKRLEGSSWRLRATATHPDFRNQGLASAVLEHGLRTLRRRDAALLWANGRSTAMGFLPSARVLQAAEERKPPGVQPHYQIERRV
ncbi:GNAT family N-acetyltransferase [Mesorhizobium erdmanii]|uniref:GNAT family N-acetyltransferase n=1 Tax=Mesorhizobium erdmanii TaxID=1777866 RepID=UPI0012B522D3|nr:GNAT family N-acetyltransferase [Mesorhizobium erdmanii]